MILPMPNFSYATPLLTVVAMAELLAFKSGSFIRLTRAHPGGRSKLELYEVISAGMARDATTPTGIKGATRGLLAFRKGRVESLRVFAVEETAASTTTLN